MPGLREDAWRLFEEIKHTAQFRGGTGHTSQLSPRLAWRLMRIMTLCKNTIMLQAQLASCSIYNLPVMWP